ncbi:hypothetical protein QNI19_18780 [Cytophagaceae bacterium DM2B3-1]|uniref:Uncharacterized protein n=1 Tax=Xanthocytophaga flava TaxID=3048013 RepID=A0ABT7CN61_9BACT|nr:hypothetical protein [Xanthocytophaga flavus]MDJ1494991.1 hypothetical protein [Xanthocytophaga flavus]
MSPVNKGKATFPVLLKGYRDKNGGLSDWNVFVFLTNQAWLYLSRDPCARCWCYHQQPLSHRSGC